MINGYVMRFQRHKAKLPDKTFRTPQQMKS